MNITELVQSSGWKNFMAKLYGMGATVVIVGALFKINHWPGGTIVITAGLVTEAIIFFFSSFEPLHEELDWTLVYPELAGMTDPDELDNLKDEVIGGKSDRPLKKFDELLEKSDIDTDSFSKLGEGLNKLNQTATHLSDISDASLVTQEYFANLKAAANAVNSLSSSYENTNESLRESVGQLSDSYNKAADVIQKSGSNIALSYEKFSESMVNNFDAISSGNKNYQNHLEILNKNLTALNAVYELQLQNNNEHLSKSKEIYKGFDGMMKDLEKSVEETKRYKQVLTDLSDNLSSLNAIYGNMLSAMQVVSTK